MASNGTGMAPLQPGVYAPIVTIFDSNEDLDIPAQRKHAVRLVKDGLQGLVAMGSNGEAVHLSRSERTTLISEMRQALDEADFQNVPIIAGCSAQSVRESLEMCREAQTAGAAYAMVLSPCYYRPTMTNQVIHDFFLALADQSPIPVLMYNYPGAVAGIDLDSDLMTSIGQHKNVVGAKFTCGNTGKLTRVSNAMDTITAQKPGGSFLATGGMADMIIQTAVSGGSGVIAGTANVCPKLCVKIWDLWADGKHTEAMRLQRICADADWVLAKSVVPNTKEALQRYFDYGGIPRKPLPAVADAQAKAVGEGIAEAMEVEKSL